MATPVFSKDIASLSRANAQTSVPVDLSANHRTREKEHLMLLVNRLRDGTTGALDGTVSVYGANLPEKMRPDATHVVSTIVLPTAGTAYYLDTEIAYAAFSNYNWIVKVDGVIQGYKAAPDAANLFKVATNAGKARITIGDTSNRPVDGAEVEVYFVAPAELLADGANEVIRSEVLGTSVAWAVTTGTPASATKVSVESRA